MSILLYVYQRAMLLVRTIVLRILAVVLCLSLSFIMAPGTAQAASGDRYIREFLKATDAVPVRRNDAGDSQVFSPEQLSQGKDLFKDSCINCHVGGNTLPNPAVSLSQAALQGATPSRDNLTNLIAYMRDPMSYDGSDYGYLCRQVTENWMSQPEIENLAAFILRAADVAPGWGTEQFQDG